MTVTANSLNQYTNRTMPGYVNVIGSASTNATVSIWGSDGSYSATSRKGTYYRGELAVDNTTNALWLTVTNVAVLPNGSNPDIVTNTIGNGFLAQTPEAFAYDLDGNQSSDGRWTNNWNGENRLIQMVCLTNAPSGSKLRLTFGYDFQGRRISKQVETWSGSAWSATLSNKFVYDGWNLIAELNGTNNAMIRSYMWGTDLSGSQQGAGGVGGLLAENDAVQGVHFAAFDGNGNVAGLVKASDSTISASYEHGPFGELVKASGPMAKINPIRFSTKYQDDETDLLYYGYRYYSPSLGRWLSHDPVEEIGGSNLFSAGQNDAIDMIDALGLSCQSGNFRTLALGTSGNLFGNLKWKFEAKAQIKVKLCDKCCSDGRKVTDEEEEWGAYVAGNLSGSTSGGSIEFGYGKPNGGFVTEVKAGYWYGVKGEVGGSGEGSGVFKTDKCHNKGMNGSFCVTGTVAGSLGIGGEITLQWGWFRTTAGLNGTASGSVSATRCYSCSQGACRWSKWKICEKGSIDVTFSFLAGSIGLNVANGSKCFEVE